MISSLEQPLHANASASCPLPLVSVIMPAYNAARYIERAICSVLAQTYQNWELIIVDDASTDPTESVATRFEDARIRYRRVTRIGHPSGVRNVALKMAQGEFIAFLDADDVYFPDTLMKLSRPLLNRPELSAVYGFSAQIDEHEAPLPNTIELVPDPNRETEAEPPYQLPPTYSHSWENIVTSQISCLLPGLMLRRSAWEQIGFFNETLGGTEDYEFYVRMFLHHYEGVYCLPDYVYQYRLHAASLTKSPARCAQLLESCLEIMDWLFNEAAIPQSVRHLKSKAYVACYRYLARERLLHGQPGIARQLAVRALLEKNIAKADALKACGPLIIRSFLPDGLNRVLVMLRRNLRQALEVPAQGATCEGSL